MIPNNQYLILFLLLLFSILSEQKSPHHKLRHKRQGLMCNWYNCLDQREYPFCEELCVVQVQVVGCCQQPQYECCKYREQPGFCPTIEQTECLWPYPEHFTVYYQCHHDFTCPIGFKCCQDPCYVHKICKPAVDDQGFTEASKEAPEGEVKQNETTTVEPKMSTPETHKVTVKEETEKGPLLVSIQVVTKKPNKESPAGGGDGHKDDDDDDYYYYDASYYQ